jgi:maltooligosyltrehalose trehalohydrolase
MPFGAQLTPDGRVRFRLWAPAARSVELVLEPSRAPRRTLPLEPLANGWYELVTGEARAGSRYRYRIDGAAEVPDPASRRNPEGVHGPSEVVDAAAFAWPVAPWRARPWREVVVYELHVGTFTPEGTFAGVQRKLGYLRSLGVTAIELMPIGEFAGRRGWGYDGVLPYAPESAYGTPEELKSLVAGAHALGLAVMLDVVYNHFGPEGNYLHLYAPQFFTTRHATPWGAAIDFEGGRADCRDDPHGRPVREFFIHNALYWLEEYHLDGLRFDAVHAIFDHGDPHILTQIARAARRGPGRERPIYLVLENLANQAHLLGPPGAPDTFDAQWNDDFHHCLHVLLSGERDGYYQDFKDDARALLCRCLAEGFAFQGEVSQYLGGPRGERSSGLPPTAFVNFVQNHDQVGNRARGERLTRLVANPAPLRAAAAVLLLAPSPPMLFMGEEWAAPEPFAYFCDFEPLLAEKVRDGRRREFARFADRLTQGVAQPLPDPVSEATLARARLDWSLAGKDGHAAMLDHYRQLLAIRERDILPHVAQILSSACVALDPGGAFGVDWTLRDGGTLHLLANLSSAAVRSPGRPAGSEIFSTHPHMRGAAADGEMAPWSVSWLLERGGGRR